MSWLDDLRFRWRAVRKRDDQEAALDEELEFHRQMELDQRMARGESPREAERAVRIEFGGPQQIKEECRDAWGVRMVDEGWRDLRGAARHLLEARSFSIAAIGSLAIGIGAAVVIFSVVDAVLLQPLPFEQPDRVVALYELTPNGDRFSTSDPNLLDFRERSRTLSDVAAISFPVPRPALGRGGDRIRLAGLAVTPSFFRVLGVQAQLGRTFGEEEEQPQFRSAETSPRVAVLAHESWQQTWGGDQSIVGQDIDLDGELWTVIGVLPPRFRYGDIQAEIYLPYVLDPAYQRGDHRLDGLARLAPDVTLPEAQAEIAAIAGQLGSEYPESNENWGAELERLDEVFLGRTGRRTTIVLLGAAGLLLLLACVNVSNLILARASDRSAEVQLRFALGASRGRVLKQLLTESVVLGGLGAGFGLMLSLWVVPVVRRLDASLPRIDQMTIDLRVFGFAAAIAVVTGLLFGILPALRVTSGADGHSVRARKQGADRKGARLRSVMVAAEVALATLLLVGAGLLYRSYTALQSVDSGFETRSVLLAQIDLPQDRYGESQDSSRAFYEQLMERVEALPGVEAAGANIVSPFRGPSPTNTVATEQEVERQNFVQVEWRSITADYFETVHIPMLRGRTFDSVGEARLEVVVSAQLAERLWPSGDALGQQLRWNRPDGPLFEVIGVVGEVQDLRLGLEPSPVLYHDQRVIAWPTMTLAVRTSGPPESLADPVRSVVREIDPLLASPDITMLEEQRREALAQPLLSLRLLAVFALIALLLAAIGVYGIVAYSVSQRRHELGLRLALGAQSGQLSGLVVRSTVLLITAGLAAGLAVSMGLVGTLRALLYETSPFDPRVLGGAVAMLALVGALASWMPALRIGRLDPAKTLRAE